jgi:hypothetical protein
MGRRSQGRKKKAGRRPPRKVSPEPDDNFVLLNLGKTKHAAEAPPPQPSRSERIKGAMRSIAGKVAHDGAAVILKEVLKWGGPPVGSLLVGLALYFGVPPTWLAWHLPQIETGSIKSAEEKAKKREIECEVAKARKGDALTERRKGAWASYDSCKSSWSPGLFDKRTAEEACAAKRQAYRDLAQQVQDEQAKDCTVTSSQPRPSLGAGAAGK